MTARRGQTFVGEREILIVSVDGARIEARSDSGKEYVIAVGDAPERSRCSCPSWIFRGSKPDRSGRRPPPGTRWPCVHLRTLFAAVPGVERLRACKLDTSTLIAMRLTLIQEAP